MQDGQSTRRSFLKGGAIVAMPHAAVAPGVARADDRTERLLRLENEAAIRALHQDWLRRVNGGLDTAALFLDAKAAPRLDSKICAIAPDHASDDFIEIATDGRTAWGAYSCLIESETQLTPQNTLAQMALAQGSGRMRAHELKLVAADYVKLGGVWVIARIEMREV